MKILEYEILVDINTRSCYLKGLKFYPSFFRVTCLPTGRGDKNF